MGSAAIFPNQNDQCKKSILQLKAKLTSSVLRPTRIAPDCAPPFVRDARTRYRRGSRPSGMFCFRAGHLDHCHRYSTPAGPGDEYLRVRSILCTPLRLHVGSPRRTAGIVRWAHAESLLTVPRNSWQAFSPSMGGAFHRPALTASTRAFSAMPLAPRRAQVSASALRHRSVCERCFLLEANRSFVRGCVPGCTSPAQRGGD